MENASNIMKEIIWESTEKYQQQHNLQRSNIKKGTPCRFLLLGVIPLQGHNTLVCNAYCICFVLIFCSWCVSIDNCYIKTHNWWFQKGQPQNHSNAHICVVDMSIHDRIFNVSMIQNLIYPWLISPIDTLFQIFLKSYQALKVSWLNKNIYL